MQQIGSLERFRLKRNCQNRSRYLSCRIIHRVDASHFCWKCSRTPGIDAPRFPPSPRRQPTTQRCAHRA
ncbi:hypothetical protein CN884_14170 [Ochrobactrum sp. 30A/1000/2015]|nr:hypothetical protein CN884_14170 [Ochrobactrum sp. 30A/1000/2015]